MTAAPAIATMTSPEVTAQVTFGGHDLIRQWAGAWQELCDQNHCPPFFRPEWIAAYLNAFERHSELALFTAHAAGKLVAVLPMVRKHAWYAGVPVIKLCGAANAHSVRYGMVRSAGPAGDAAVPAIWGLIKRMQHWHIAELPMVAENGACENMLKLAQQDGYRALNFLVQESPILHMTRDGDGKLTWLGGTSRHFRHELRRFARLLEETSGGKARLLRFDHPEPSVMKRFYALEAAGWKGQEGSAIHCHRATQAFYDQIAREAARRGYFSLHTLEVGGQMAAGAFSVTTPDCFYPMKIAYKEEWRRGGPGHLLFNGILEECAANNIPELFFGGSKDRYKTSWTGESILHYDAVIFAPSFRGQLAFHVRTQLLSRLGKLRRNFRAWSLSRKPLSPMRTSRGADSRAAVSQSPIFGAQASGINHNKEQIAVRVAPAGSTANQCECKIQLQESGRSRVMKVSLICCPFKTSFGSYAQALKSALERKTGDKVQWVGTNCGCGDPIEVNRDFEAKECDYFEFPILVDFRSKSAWKRRLRGAARGVLVGRKARRYAELSQDADVVHFQQILNAFGSKGVFSWLRQSTPKQTTLQQPSKTTRVVTVHELDSDQTEAPETNLTYNLADAVIAHCEEMRQQLIKLGVQQEKVHVVLHGTDLPELDPTQKREGLVFYGGHKLMSGKGIEILFKAMAIIQKQLGDATPTLTIHGHYGPVTPEEGKMLAEENHIAGRVVWANQISDHQIMRLYQQSAVCVLPYTGSFAGQPASFAAAAALPVICTRKAGLPDHLGDTAIYIEETPGSNDGASAAASVEDKKARQLADRILELLRNDMQGETRRQQVGARLRARAEKLLGWDTIADQTLKIYQGGSVANSQSAKAS